MTRPPQPQEYGAGPKPPQPVEYGQTKLPQPTEYGQASAAWPFTKEYRNPITGQPYEGDVHVFQDGTRILTAALVGGVFRADLPSGRYQFKGEVVADGRVRYLDEAVVV